MIALCKGLRLKPWPPPVFPSNLVNIYDVGQQDECYYIVMEYVQGQTLKELIEREAPLPIEKR